MKNSTREDENAGDRIVGISIYCIHKWKIIRQYCQMDGFGRWLLLDRPKYRTHYTLQCQKCGRLTHDED